MTEQAPAASRVATCPEWCVSAHGVHLGEEDWVHQGEPLVLADDLSARLCMSVDPVEGVADGPYVVIGSHEYNLPAAAALGTALVAMAAVGAARTP